jgi:hypothetical protein
VEGSGGASPPQVVDEINVLLSIYGMQVGVSSPRMIILFWKNAILLPGGSDGNWLRIASISTSRRICLQAPIAW